MLGLITNLSGLQKALNKTVRVSIWANIKLSANSVFVC